MKDKDYLKEITLFRIQASLNCLTWVVVGTVAFVAVMAGCTVVLGSF